MGNVCCCCGAAEEEAKLTAGPEAVQLEERADGKTIRPSHAGRGLMLNERLSIKDDAKEEMWFVLRCSVL